MATLRTVTVKSSGGDYTSLQAAETGEQGDLVSLDRQLDIECHNIVDGSVTFAGWTTDATRYVRVYAAQHHGGSWSTSAYRIVTATNPVAVTGCAFIRFQGIQIDCTHTGTNNRTNLFFDTTADTSTSAYVEGCIFRRSVAPTGGTHRALAVADADWVVRVSNCLFFWELTNITGTMAFQNTPSGGTVYLYNCTSYGWDTGFRRQSGITTVINCLVQASVDGYNGTFAAASDYNVSNIAADAPGSNSRQSQTTTFVNAAGLDFHLASGDTSSINFGTNLSADANYPISVDIDNVTRAGTWDIGADEFVATGFARSYGYILG